MLKHIAVPVNCNNNLVPVLQILTKSLLPLPDKYYGLADVELRHRQR